MIILVICGHKAYKSTKFIGKYVANVLFGLLPPVLGNFIIIATEQRVWAIFGYYIYFLGMDLVVFCLFNFTSVYCNYERRASKLRIIVNTFLLIDVFQYIINLFTHHAFSIKKIMLEGKYYGIYYKLVPYFGLAFHRIVCYGIFLITIIILLKKIIQSSSLMFEKYIVIFLTMLFAGVWQFIYIFSGTPINRSMIGFAVCGIIIYYFALCYQPVYLLNKMLADLTSSLTNAILFFDDRYTCIWANKTGQKLLNVNEDDLIKVPQKISDLLNIQYLNLENEFHEQFSVKQQNDTKYYEAEKKLIKDKKNKTIGFFISIRDDTEEKQLLEKERYNAIHDRLTDLYTREYLYEKTDEIIHSNKNKNYFILFFDINNFKFVNDVFGKEFGDYTLIRVAKWIQLITHEKGICGRITGDMFGACIAETDFNEDEINHDLQNAIIEKDGLKHTLLIHVGIYKVDDLSIPVSTMFDWAHLAIISIKNDYQTYIAYYNKDLRDKVLWNQTISSQLDEAIKTKQIRPYLQPMVDSDKNIVGAEALVRWIHPINGFMSPALFIPYFETNGMITKIDKYMWECACQILAKWKNENKDLFISVNISPKDFYFINVAAEIIKLVKKYNIDPQKLRIEITETILENDINIRLNELNTLKNNGFIIEMDDFGSGYSSLNLLKDMPIDVLKIDMAFLNKSKDGEKAEKILYNIMNMSDDLSITSLTEGVETKKQYEALLNIGCKMFQGYYFAKPMPIEDFEKLVNET